MATEIKLTGFAELEEKLKTLGPKAVSKVGSKALKKGGEVIADDARVRVPVDTGKLQDSITVVSEHAQDTQEVRASIGFRKGKPSMARRATFVEFGTSKMAAKPFMRPAIDARGLDAIAAIGGEMWKGIEAEAKKGVK